jgi:hypothetical protein
MVWTVSSPITGGAQTGLTSPTYTVVDDHAPDVNMEQVAVTALGGTQTDVRTHTISDPFTITISKPKVPKTLGNPNPVTGRYASVPKNVTTVRVRKGVNIAADCPPELMQCVLHLEIPAGSDAYDAVNIRAALSALVGILSQQSSGLGDSLVTGVI